MSTIDEMVIPQVPVYRLSVNQYHSMIESGLLTNDDRVELLHGWIVPKMSNNPPHSVATELTADALRSILPPGYCLRSEKPITLSDSEPEPDIIIAVGNARQYVNQHPMPAQIAVVVEVSDTTLSRDRQLKLELYAAAGIACYWIIDLTNKKVEVYTDPIGSAYANRQIFSERVPLRIGDSPPHEIPVATLLP